MADPIVTLHQLISNIISSHPEVKYNFSGLSGFQAWQDRSFNVPCPNEIKRSVLERNNLLNSTWIETGTLYGETSIFLSKIASKVITIEPEPILYSKAFNLFKNYLNIEIINNISENIFPSLLPQLKGNVCLYLDGHYSANDTYKGPNDTPLVQELESLKSNILNYDKCNIIIDDIRLCGNMHVYGFYPSLDFLVDWARSLGLSWHIEYDMFIIKKV
jgi:hypothetical protein